MVGRKIYCIVLYENSAHWIQSPSLVTRGCDPGEGFMVWLDIVSTCELGSGKATNCSDRSKPEVKEGDSSPCVKIHKQLHPRYI